jgi:two-component system cell cycle sensor histidine kinase/response regulator CckA
VAALHSLGQGKHVNTILILDDEAPIRTLLRVTLCPLGYTLVEAATANEAVRCLEYADAGLDLLIADVYLTGDPSGVRVALELRSKLPFLRIILMSGVPLTFWDDQDAAEWSALPPDSVVTLEKPFHAAELLHSVHKLIGVPMVWSGVCKRDLDLEDGFSPDGLT